MISQKKIFRSNGKLLLTGEYLVLKGAEALAVPLYYGQSLSVTELDALGDQHVIWKAFTPGDLWFEVEFELPELNIIRTTDSAKAIKLQIILLTIKQIKPELFQEGKSYSFMTHLGFEPEWGFGSSSTLIANLAQWAGVSPYTLLNLSIGGSGYDIACATNDQPIIYRLNNLRPVIRSAGFHPAFSNNLYFVYSGIKQHTDDSVKMFNKAHENNDLTAIVDEVTRITRKASRTKLFDEFCQLMNRHEEIISSLLLIPSVKFQFDDFPGHLKSLGAWGGDFVMAMTELSDNEVRSYFKGKGLQTVFAFRDLIKTGNE